MRPYFYINLVLFFLAIAAGYITGYYYPEIVNELTAQFEESFGWIAEESPLVIMLFIFANNTINSFIAMLVGIFFGIWPVLFVMINGFFIGAVVFDSIQQYGGLVILAALIPHGIIEIPVILISTSIGLRLGVLMYQKIFKKKDIRIKYEVFIAVRFFITVIVPLLFIAAVIETFITSTILYLLTS